LLFRGPLRPVRAPSGVVSCGAATSTWGGKVPGGGGDREGRKPGGAGDGALWLPSAQYLEVRKD